MITKVDTDVDVLDKVLAAGEGRLSLRLHSDGADRTFLAVLCCQDQWVDVARAATIAGAIQALGMGDWCQEFLRNHKKTPESQDF